MKYVLQSTATILIRIIISTYLLFILFSYWVLINVLCVYMRLYAIIICMC